MVRKRAERTMRRRHAICFKVSQPSCNAFFAPAIITVAGASVKKVIFVTRHANLEEDQQVAERAVLRAATKLVTECSRFVKDTVEGDHRLISRTKR